MQTRTRDRATRSITVAISLGVPRTGRVHATMFWHPLRINLCLAPAVFSIPFPDVSQRCVYVVDLRERKRVVARKGMTPKTQLQGENHVLVVRKVSCTYGDSVAC